MPRFTRHRFAAGPMLRFAAAALLLLALAVAAADAASTPFRRVLVRDAVGQGAMCLDGTAPGYYYRPGTVRKWVVHLEGSGWCTNQFECQAWMNTTKGSSASWPLELNTLGGILSEYALPLRSFSSHRC